jgi:predicted nucleotidyltransferase
MKTVKNIERIDIAEELARDLSQFKEITAIALGGSFASDHQDVQSDIDLYVYFSEGHELSCAQRNHFLDRRQAQYREIGNQFWELGDEWQEATGIFVDVTYRTKSWIEEQLRKVLEHHEASTGYSTCLWGNVLSSRLLFDQPGWYSQLQDKVRVVYPEPLRQAIIGKNYPILRQTISSYKHQLEKALARRDMVSVNHRTAAFVASYFDIVFAINRIPHPGEKRLVQLVKRDCKVIPQSLEIIPHLLNAGAEGNATLLMYLDQLVDGLDEVLNQ